MRPDNQNFVKIAALLLIAAPWAAAAERQVDPTFLHRYVPSLAEKKVDISTGTCHYRPIFGEGDDQARVLRGVARYGEVTLDPGGSCNPVSYPREEQVYFVLDGTGVVRYGEDDNPVRKHDFMYLSPGVQHGVANPSRAPLRFVVMGFRIPANVAVTPPPKLPLANSDDVKLQVVGNHPPSTQYRLLMGDTKSTRDRIAAGHVLTSLYIMEFAPGGTNFPHHHDREEEIYMLLDGHGEMVAGGGMDGVEGKHPAKPGDAYFFRLNCTVGFYNASDPGTPKAHILAVRSLYPRGR